jgi:hypothetical protein
MTNAEYLELEEFAKTHTVKLGWVVDIQNHVFTDRDFYVHKLLTEYGTIIDDLSFVNAGLAKPFGIPKPEKPIDIERELVQILEFELKYPRPIVAILFVRMLDFIKTLSPEAICAIRMTRPDPEPFAYMRIK